MCLKFKILCNIVIFLVLILTQNIAIGNNLKFPYQADLGFCSATVISKNWLITTASCFDKQNITSGYATIHGNQEKVKYASVTKHPEYSWFGNRVPINDVALLKLERPLKNAVWLELPQTTLLHKEASFIHKTEGSPPSNINLQVIPFSDCKSNFRWYERLLLSSHSEKLIKNQICSKRLEEPPGECATINGGAMVHDKTLYGLASTSYDYGETAGPNCHRLYFFSNLISFVGWINSVINQDN